MQPGYKAELGKTDEETMANFWRDAKLYCDTCGKESDL